ncbi:MAG TPA: gliding motility-associated C-terminal domain-containing protein [Saprospiraceae bacterium]|nr:gliding motility-associated C-terminal domain-containing protein [Saprospiraceae bacterium]
MRRSFLFSLLFFALCFSLQVIHAQINDCRKAMVVCNDDNLTLNPQGPGIDDYLDPDNDPGCMIDRENNSAWYYFEIDDNAPGNLRLGFIIHPNGGFGEDYDWALYGPDVLCNHLGSPVRCSSSSAACDFCPETGMGKNTTDVSEGPGSGDGFVRTLMVQPGQGFFLMIDNWQGTQNGFELSWTESAAAYLNCNAEVPCGIVAIAGPDIITCRGNQTSISLHGSAGHIHGREKYNWSGTNGGTDFLSNPDIANPDVHLPEDFSGSLLYTLTVTEDSCVSSDKLSVVVSFPEVNITPAGPFCESASPQTLSASPVGGTWGGAVNGNVFDPRTHDPGIHTITYSYTDSNHCTNSDSMYIEVGNHSGITVSIGEDITLSLGENALIETVTNFSMDQIDTIVWYPGGIIECLNPSCFNVSLLPLNNFTLSTTVYDINGCSATDDINIFVTKDRRVFIPNAFSPNHDGFNDIFHVSVDPRQIIAIKKLVIYNRWGAIVYDSIDFLQDDVTDGWDGVDEDGNINPGVYVCAVEIEFIDGITKRYTGDVTVVR